MRLTLLLRDAIPKLPKNPWNLPDKYIKKQTEFINFRPPLLPNYARKILRYRKDDNYRKPQFPIYYDIHRPWEREFQEANSPGVKQPRIWVEPFRRFPVFKGDRVEIMVGRDKGKQGHVQFVVEERNWVCVEGLNLGRRIRNKTDYFCGVVDAVTKPLLYPSEVQLVDPTDKKPSMVEWRYDEDGNQIRISLRSERVVPIPLQAYETIDYKQKTLYVEEAKDTKAADVEKITYEPKIKTFEMDIMDQMGIKETRIPYQFWWY